MNIEQVYANKPKNATHYRISAFNQTLYFKVTETAIKFRFRNKWVAASDENIYNLIKL